MFLFLHKYLSFSWSTNLFMFAVGILKAKTVEEHCLKLLKRHQLCTVVWCQFPWKSKRKHFLANTSFCYTLSPVYYKIHTHPIALNLISLTSSLTKNNQKVYKNQIEVRTLKVYVSLPLFPRQSFPASISKFQWSPLVILEHYSVLFCTLEYILTIPPPMIYVIVVLCAGLTHPRA